MFSWCSKAGQGKRIFINGGKLSRCGVTKIEEKYFLWKIQIMGCMCTYKLLKCVFSRFLYVFVAPTLQQGTSESWSVTLAAACTDGLVFSRAIAFQGKSAFGSLLVSSYQPKGPYESYAFFLVVYPLFNHFSLASCLPRYIFTVQHWNNKKHQYPQWILFSLFQMSCWCALLMRICSLVYITSHNL